MDTIISLDGRELTDIELQQVMGGTRHREHEHHGRRHHRDRWDRDYDYSWWDEDDEDDCWYY